MANKGKRETKKQITEVKQELQKELDKMSRVRSHISTQQDEEVSQKRKKSSNISSQEPTITTTKISATLEESKSKTKIPKTPISSKQKTQKKLKETLPNISADNERDIKGTGRKKGARDKQPRKASQPKSMIQEAQEKMQERRQEINNIHTTDSDVVEQIQEQDEIAIDRFETDQEYAEAFYIGEMIEEQIITMCNEARTYAYTSKTRISWVENKLQESKLRFGKDVFYQNLWNKQGEILEHCQVIVWSSENQDVSFNENKLFILLFDIPFDQLES